MITVKQLRDYLTTFKNAPVNLPPGIEAETVKAIQDESKYSFDFLAHYISGDENFVLSRAVIEGIRNYLSIRWETLKRENIAYTRFPFLPINQFCLKIAEGIAGPNEAVCSILMPGIKGLNRACVSLKFETEDNGHFEVEKFIVNQDYTKLIPIEEVFQTAALNSNHVILDFQPQGTKLSYEFGGQDFLNLANVAGDASRAFIQALKQNHIQRYDNNSLGFAIKKLATELKKASVSDAGSEELVNNKVLGDAVTSFYALWKQLPPELSMPKEDGTAASETRYVKDIKLKAYGYKLPLESYFLTLFFHMQLPITEEEGARVVAEDVFPCADQLSNILSEFLNQYPALYQISIQENRNEVVEKLPSMADLLPAVLNILPHRPPVWDAEDNLDSKFMKLLIATNCGAPARTGGLVFIAERIKSYSGLRLVINTPSLLSSVALLIHARLAVFPYESNLHTLLPFIPEAQQQVIVEAHAKELIKEYNTGDKYKLLTQYLKSTPLDFLRKKYAETLAPDIRSVDELCALTKKVDNPTINQVFGKLQDKYPELLNSYENTLKILKVIRETNGQQAIINFITPCLRDWITPENFNEFNYWLNPSIPFSSLIANQIKNHINSFDTWKKEYIRWKNCAEIQPELGELFTQFPTDVKTSDTLLSIVEATSCRERLTIIAKYKDLLNSKELFTQFAKLIPEQHQERYLSLISWEGFVSSIKEIEEIGAYFTWKNIGKIIPQRFSAAQLHCTEEEFSALSRYSPQDKAMIDQFDCKSAADELKHYMENRMPHNSFRLVFFGRGASEYKLKIVNELIESMESEQLTPLEKIDALRTALYKLMERNHMTHSRGGELEKIITGILEGKKTSSYKSNFATAMFLRYEHLHESEHRLNPLCN